MLEKQIEQKFGVLESLAVRPISLYRLATSECLIGL